MEYSSAITVKRESKVPAMTFEMVLIFKDFGDFVDTAVRSTFK